MKVHQYDKCGIHSRLKNTINKSGGYNVRLASELLMIEYQIRNSEIAYEMAKNEHIRDEIDAVGIDAVIDLTKKSIAIRKIKLNGCISMLNRLSKTY